jgi:hypothetical protein
MFRRISPPLAAEMASLIETVLKMLDRHRSPES